MALLPTEQPGVYDLTFFVPGGPITQGSLRSVGPRGGRSRLVHDKAKALDAWRRAIALAARDATGRSFAPQAPVELGLTFILPRPPTIRRSEPAVRPDIDKLIRAVLDALTGVLWADDGQVVAVVARKVYSRPPGLGPAYATEPGVHVRAIGQVSDGPVVKALRAPPTGPRRRGGARRRLPGRKA